MRCLQTKIRVVKECGGVHKCYDDLAHQRNIKNCKYIHVRSGCSDKSKGTLETLCYISFLTYVVVSLV